MASSTMTADAGSGTAAGVLRDAPMPAIAREGWPIVFVMALVGAAASAAAVFFLGVWGSVVAAAAVVIVAWGLWFFRDPARRIPADEGALISPADGVVCAIVDAAPPVDLGLSAEDARGTVRVSVFMNVFNVHVNRSPAAGAVVASAYRPGKFFNASLDKASEHNERQSLAIRLSRGPAAGRVVAFVQIAGLVARRIVCRVKPGDALGAGERFGLIRFGSRVDVYVPPGFVPSVKVGEKMVAGETVLARWGGGAVSASQVRGV